MKSTNEKNDEKLEKTEKKPRNTISKIQDTIKKVSKSSKKAAPKEAVVDSKAENATFLKENPSATLVEYYDLPYRYNQTVIKILAQTPHSIYVYWDISDNDLEKMKEQYGENVFNDTRPVLLVHNKTTNHNYEVEIDDFANSWYLRTPDSNCSFSVELGRKKIPHRDATIINSPDNTIHIVSSNNLKSPNDTILADTVKNKVVFMNVKTHEKVEKSTNDLTPITHIFEAFENEFLHNPSSSFNI